MSNRDVWDSVYKTPKQDYLQAYLDNVEDNFDNLQNSYTIYKNNDLVTEYKAIINNLDSFKKLVDAKEVIMYPYQTIEVGDYINWNSEDWLVIADDTQYEFNRKGYIKKTNSNLKWIDSNGVEQVYKCVIDDKFTEEGVNVGKIDIKEGEIVVYVPKDSETTLLEVDARFIFGKQGFKIAAINDFTSYNDKLIILTMEIDVVEQDDNLTDDVANEEQYVYTIEIVENNFEQVIGYTTQLSAIVKLDGEIVTKDVTWSSDDTGIATIDASGNLELISSGSVQIGVAMTNNEDVDNNITVDVVAVPSGNIEVIITPDNTEILQGQNQTYTVYKYTDNVQQVDTFTVLGSNVPTDNYTIEVVDGNTFTISNISRYLDNDLTVTVTSDVDASVGTIEIKLKGLW